MKSNVKSIFLPFLIVFLILPFIGIGQVTFSNIPSDKQLFSRSSASNLAIFKVEGQVNSNETPYQVIRINLIKSSNGVYEIIESKEQILIYAGGLADFSFNFSINAELASYSVSLFGIIGTESENIILPTGTGTNFVAGDVYVIQGQSNAESKIYEGTSAAYQSEYIRVFANGTNNSESLVGNNKWYYGNGDAPNYGNGNTGQWGLKFAKEIIDHEKIPVAIFNGASGGKPIAYFEKDFNEADQELNCYNRLMYRLEFTGLKESVKGVFWSQGESDINTTLQEYVDSFRSIRQAWKEDFISLQKIYIFQSKSSCSTPSLMHVKEAQRRVAMEDYETDIIQTAALAYAPPLAPNIDCHFSFKGGYEEFGNRLYQLVKRDIYGASLGKGIETPLVLDSYFLNDKTIIIETDAESLNMSMPVENIQLNNAGVTNITNINVKDNQIYLSLSDFPGFNVSVSHLGFSRTLSNTDRFITNDSGIELVSFHLFPVRSANVTVWENSQWSNGIPNASISAVINAPYKATNGNIESLDLTVNSTLDFDENTGNSIVVHRNLEIAGSVLIGDKESLVMTDDYALISGEITKFEKSFDRKDMNELSYWSSSVAEADIKTIFPDVNPQRIFLYDQSKTSSSSPDNDRNGDYWSVWTIASGKMLPGIGYASEGPQGTIGTHLISFSGKPNNGIITVDLKGNFGDDDFQNDFNFLGNPYPSAIEIEKFLTENEASIDPTVYLWVHNTENSGDDYTSSYFLTYNILGGTSISSEGINVPSRFINSAQGFFVRALNPGTILFNNSMRSVDANSNFDENDIDGDGFDKDSDCDDSNASINPGAVEILYNDIDDDCNPQTLDYKDADNDGYKSDVDCDDSNPDVYPGAKEVPNNGVDEDCDGYDLLIGEVDFDLDGFNSLDDCDDLDENIYPGAIEIPNNGIDEDCDGFDLIQEETCELRVSGSLNINPNKATNKTFLLLTPSVEIDFNKLNSTDSDFSYRGEASLVRIKVKSQGRYLSINGENTKLETSKIYTIKGDLQVRLFNDKIQGNNASSGHWWIEIEGTEVCISNEKDRSFNDDDDHDDDDHDDDENDGDDDYDDDDDEDNDDGKSKRTKDKLKDENQKQLGDLIWISLKSNEGGFDQILLGFSEHASKEIDKGYDALKIPISNNPIALYSTINNQKYAIQGLNTLDEEEQIALGFDTQLYPRNFTISIDKTEGILNDAQLYIKDNVLNILHDLKVADYQFEHNEPGDYKNRFTLIISLNRLGLDVEEESQSKGFTLYSFDNSLHIESSKIVQNIKVYNILGEILIDVNPGQKHVELGTIQNMKGSILIINAVLEDGSRINKKTIHF